MGMYNRIEEFFQGKTGEFKSLERARLIKWRREEPSVIRIEKPTNLATARKKGYRAKQGFVIVRVRIKKGRRKKIRVWGGRKSSKSGTRFMSKKSQQLIAEGRAARMFRNLEVLNSYKVAADGVYSWFEIILVDLDHPAIRNDKRVLGGSRGKTGGGRVFRGKTSAGRKMRGLR